MHLIIVLFLFVGQNPSYRRFKETNCAFTGGIGDQFKQMLKDLGIIKGIYFANVVKCSTPNNKLPSNKVLNNCKEYIFKEIENLNPKIIVPMGNFAISFFNENKEQFKNYEIVSIWHPNYVLSYKKDKINEYKRKLLKIKQKAYCE